MLTATVVTTQDELTQIHLLNKQNLKQNLSEEEKNKEGFVTWLYSMELLQQVHQLESSVIVKDAERVIGYALVTPREAAAFHPDLKAMVDKIEDISYKNKLLKNYAWYAMGQVCIDKAYRGKGVFSMLYQHHKKVYQTKYDLLITEISTSNIRSQRAHEKVGFKTIDTYRDSVDEWNIVIWDWQTSKP